MEATEGRQRCRRPAHKRASEISWPAGGWGLLGALSHGQRNAGGVMFFFRSAQDAGAGSISRARPRISECGGMEKPKRCRVGRVAAGLSRVRTGSDGVISAANVTFEIIYDFAPAAVAGAVVWRGPRQGEIRPRETPSAALQSAILRPGETGDAGAQSLRRLRCGVFFAPSQRAILLERLPTAQISDEASVQAGQGGPAAGPGAVLALSVAPAAPARAKGRQQGAAA